MTKAARALGQACVSLNHIFDPEMFVFGGGVIEACGEFILPKVEAALKADPFFKHLDTPQVVRAKLGDDAVMLGAVASVRQALRIRGDSGAYYPAIKVLSPEKIQIKGKIKTASFFVRADAKVRETGEKITTSLNESQIKEICRKGPDVLFIAGKKNARVALAPKARRYLIKEKIALRILPHDKTIAAYTACEERKAILFII
jgi:glucokinase